MAPVVKALEKKRNLTIGVCLTGQHRGLVDDLIRFFQIHVDYDLDVLARGKGLVFLTSEILACSSNVLQDFKPNIVLVHGDTTSSFAMALAAFYQKIPVGHVEAGLRTGRTYSPWPEEMNRKLVANLCKFHFAPTKAAMKNLTLEGIQKSKILVTGNTVIDALLMTTRIVSNLDKNHVIQRLNLGDIWDAKKIIMVTSHRRENLGQNFDQICLALKKIARSYDEYQIVFPLHPNPDIQKTANEILSREQNITLLSPLVYSDFVFLMKESFVILTDSGGVQEEAPSLGKPVLVLRDATERPEGVNAGTLKIVGTKKETIFDEFKFLHDNPSVYQDMANKRNPYGDGNASKRIANFIAEL